MRILQKVAQQKYEYQGRISPTGRGISVSSALADRDDPDTTISWAYDRDGKVTKMTREDGTWVNYTYDDANQVTRITITNAAPGLNGTTRQDFEYDGLGRQTKAKDNNFGSAATEVTVTKYYDSLGRQVEETLRIGQTGALRATSSDWSHPIMRRWRGDRRVVRGCGGGGVRRGC